MTDELGAGGISGASLGELARLLRDVDHLEPEVRRELADVVDELEVAVRGELTAEQAEHVRASVGHVIEAIRSQRDENPLDQAREQLEATVARTASGSDLASSVARRFIELLAGLGI